METIYIDNESLTDEYEEEMYLQINPIEALKRRCAELEKLGICEKEWFYEAKDILDGELAEELYPFEPKNEDECKY